MRGGNTLVDYDFDEYGCYTQMFTEILEHDLGLETELVEAILEASGV